MISLELSESNFGMLNLYMQQGPVKVTQLASRALNRTISAVKTEQIRSAKDKYTLKSGTYKGVNVRNSNPGSLMASVNAQGSPISIDNFKVSSKKRTNKQVRITAEIKKGQSKSLGDSFIGYYNKSSIFHRIGAERVPLKQLFGPSLPQMLGEVSILDQLMLFSNAKFNERFEHEFNFEFNK